MKLKIVLFFVIVCNIQLLLGQAVPGSYPYPVPFPTNGVAPVGSQVLGGPATRSAYNDSTPAVWDSWLGGGYRSVGTTNERNLIRASWRKQGMLVNTTDDDKLWKLDSNLTNWTEVVTGGGGSGTVTDVSGTAPISVATGTTTPVISIAAATASVPGSMSAADKLKLDGISGSSSAYYHGDAFDYTVSTNNNYRIRATSAYSLNICTPIYTTTNVYPNGTTVFVRFGMFPNILTNTTMIGIKRAPTLALGDSGPAAPIYTTDGLVPEYGVLKIQRTYQMIYRELETPSGWYVADSASDDARELDAYNVNFNGRFVGGSAGFGDWVSTHNVTPPSATLIDFPGRQEGVECFSGPIATYINGLITRSTAYGFALPINHIKLGDGRTVFTTEILTPVTVDSTASYEIRCGFADTTYNAVTRGVYFRFNTATLNWQAVTELSSTENSSQDTGVVCLASTVYRFRIEIANGSSSASFFINDQLVKVETTQLFTGIANAVHGQVLIWRQFSLGGNSTLRIAQAQVYIRPDGR